MLSLLSKKYYKRGSRKSATVKSSKLDLDLFACFQFLVWNVLRVPNEKLLIGIPRPPCGSRWRRQRNLTRDMFRNALFLRCSCPNSKGGISIMSRSRAYLKCDLLPLTPRSIRPKMDHHISGIHEKWLLISTAHCTGNFSKFVKSSVINRLRFKNIIFKLGCFCVPRVHHFSRSNEISEI